MGGIMSKYFVVLTCCALLIILGGFFSVLNVEGQTATELREQINEYEARIQQLDKEIAQFEQELLKIGADKQTLQNAINELNVARQKFSADIQKTENQIYRTTLTIGQLSDEITEKESRINANREAIAETLRDISVQSDTTLIEIVLQQKNIADFWSKLAELQGLHESIQGVIVDLRDLKADLQGKVRENEVEKESLEEFRNSLSSKKQAVDANKQQQDQLLEQTENKESTFQSLLEQKRAAREQFETELRDFESQLQFVLDPSSIPQSGSGALRWPFNTNSYNPFSIITQQFGRTADSGRLYASGTHNGTDFGLPTGSELLAAASGTVRATGNTDVGRCLSYGKWVLIDHDNGLSTLYAHLSSISATRGATVNAGSVIGYSGNTGYSTGPHLHLTVFVRDGVQVVGLGEYKGGTSPCVLENVSIPVAAPEAYVDPMEYLPQN